MSIASARTRLWNGQWEFQEPKMEVPTIYKAYIRPMLRGYTPKILPCIVQYLQFRILEFALKWWRDRAQRRQGVELELRIESELSTDWATKWATIYGVFVLNQFGEHVFWPPDLWLCLCSVPSQVSCHGLGMFSMPGMSLNLTRWCPIVISWFINPIN